MKQTIFVILSFLVMLSLFLSCKNLLTEEDDDSKAAEEARLVLNISKKKTDERTIFAPNLDITLEELYYTLKGTQLGGNEITFFSAKSYTDLLDNTSTITASVGRWNFTVDANSYSYETYTTPDYSATLSNVEIAKGDNVLTFEINSIKKYGSLEITLHYPNDRNVNVETSIFNLDGTVCEAHGWFYNNVYRGYDIPTGNYIVSFRFFKSNPNGSNGMEIKPGYSELVHIRGGRTSTAERTITDFEKLHTIKYNLNGGELNGDSIPASFVEQQTVSLPDEQSLLKNGYTFAGWYTSENFVELPIAEIPCGTKNDIEIWAKWIPQVYSITYTGLNDAENANPKTYTIEDNIKFSDIVSPNKNLVFTGWVFNGNRITEIPKGTTGNIVLYAIWKIHATLSAEEAVTNLSEWISSQGTDDIIYVSITGDITESQLVSIATAIKNNPSKKVDLDLGNTTKLSKISENAFKDCKNLVNVIIPSGVTSIEKNAFYQCTGLESITIPSSVKTVGSSAFYGCTSLRVVNVSYASIWKNMNFSDYSSDPISYYNKAKLYANGKDVTKDAYTYSITYENLNYTTNPNPSYYDSRHGLELVNLTKTTAIFDCWSLNGFKITSIQPRTKGNLVLKANWIDGAIFTLQEASTKLSTWLSEQSGTGPFNVQITGAISSSTDYLKSIATALKGNPQKNVNLNLGRITGLVQLGSQFSGCTSLESIVLPKKLTTIGKEAFYNCTGLRQITIPKTVTTMGADAFYNCGNLSDVYIDSIESWCGITFTTNYSSGVGDFTYRNNPLNYARHLYVGGAEITKLEIPEGIKNINSYAFYNFQGFESVAISGSVKSIGHRSFAKSSLTQLTIKSGVPAIGDNTFVDCKDLKEVIIENGVTTIGINAFYNCTSLTNITIPSTVITINANAFRECTSLSNVFIDSIESWCGITFTYNYSSGVGDFTYQNNPLNYAKSLYIKGEKVSDLVIPIGTTRINNYAFYNFSGFTSVTISGTVESIGYLAFAKCTGLLQVTIESGASEVGNNAFAACKDLKKVTIKEGVTTLGKETFYNCTNLLEISIPSTVLTVKEDAFYGCTNLSKVSINDVESWCGITFTYNYSSGVGDFTYRNNPLYYAKHLYVGDTEITNLVIPDSTKSINSYAFYNCQGITSVTIPSRTTYIGKNAFYGCSSLTSATFEKMDGWFSASNSEAGSGISITVTDAGTNATNLCGTWSSYYLRNK